MAWWFYFSKASEMYIESFALKRPGNGNLKFIFMQGNARIILQQKRKSGNLAFSATIFVLFELMFFK